MLALLSASTIGFGSAYAAAHAHVGTVREQSADTPSDVAFGARSSLTSTVDAPLRIALPLILKQETVPALINSDFEQGPGVGWTEISSNGAALIADFSVLPTSVQPHSGTRVAWLGGMPDEMSVLAQSVEIPAYSTELKLRYWYWLASEETNCSDDFAYVQMGDARVLNEHPLCRTTDTAGWVEACVDVAGMAGQTVSLQFEAQLDGSKNSNFFIDDVRLATDCEP